MPFIELFVIFVMTIILVMYIQNHYGEVEYVVSDIDKRSYLVQKLPDKQEAANYLARVNQDLYKLAKHMIAKYPNNPDVHQLFKNYNQDALSEGSVESGYTSYSVNKGEKLILCIRQKNKQFVEKNVIMYVAIHELAHIMTPEVGHTPAFWENFKFLLKEAISLDIYKKINFKDNPHEYCGISITSSII